MIMFSFKKTNLGNCVLKDKFLLYRLRRDAMYSMWLWFYSSFKSEKNELPKYKAH
jgi:hypothetical protein